MRIGLVLLVARLGVSPAFGQLTEEKTEQIVTRVVKTELADTKTELKDYVTLQRQVLECQPEEREKHREAELRATRAALKGEIATLRMWVLAGFGLAAAALGCHSHKSHERQRNMGWKATRADIRNTTTMPSCSTSCRLKKSSRRP